jgi:hypothetical protein
MLAAGHVACVIGECAIGGRDARVVFLDPSLHLGEELRLQLFGIGHERFGITVLGFEMRPDRGIELGRIAHHRLPICRAQPSVIIHPRDAVMDCAQGSARGARSPRACVAVIHPLNLFAALTSGVEV